MKRINRPTLLDNNRRGALFASLFLSLFPFYFAAFTTSHFALIQVCICILNDSITRDPAEKIMGGFHCFFPLGHQDPTPGSSNPFSLLPPILHPSLLATLPTCPITLHSHSRTFFLDKHPLCWVYRRLTGNNS